MARDCIREPRYIPPVKPIGEQPDLFGGPTVQHVVEQRPPPKGWGRQLRKWGRCTVLADIDPAAAPEAVVATAAPLPVYLVACVAAKLDRPAPARELYTSPWFRKARAHVERQGREWFILSARYGLVAPDEIIAPYDETLSRMRAGARRLWAGRVIDALHRQVAHDAPLIVLAGRHYRDPLWPTIRHRACAPMEGLGIGEQLAWLGRNRSATSVTEQE